MDVACVGAAADPWTFRLNTHMIRAYTHAHIHAHTHMRTHTHTHTHTQQPGHPLCLPSAGPHCPRCSPVSSDTSLLPCCPSAVRVASPGGPPELPGKGRGTSSLESWPLLEGVAVLRWKCWVLGCALCHSSVIMARCHPSLSLFLLPGNADPALALKRPGLLPLTLDVRPCFSV